MERIAEIREKVTPFVVLEKPTFTILTAKGPKPVVVPISAVRESENPENPQNTSTTKC